MPADKPTELSRIKLKTWTLQPVPMISKHSAYSTSQPVGFRTWLWRYTYLLLLISMLWHRQEIFESKGDKLSSSAECRIRTQGVRHLFVSRLNACWQTDWAIKDEAEKLNSTARPYDIYIYHPLYTSWPITNADLPHVIIQYILYFICQKLYWTVSGQLSNIGYIGQFHNEATEHSGHAVPTHQSSVNVLNENIINISPFSENIDMFSHRLIYTVKDIFNIGWLTVQYRSYWTQISYIGLGCPLSNIAFFVQYNLY